MINNSTLAISPIKGLNQRKSLGEDVFEHLKKGIVTGNVKPGDRLVETRLAETLGISRTPVREAIHKLENEGFLRKLPAGGFAVHGLTSQDIDETFGIRSVLEAYAARLAAQNHKRSEIRLLEKKIDEYQDCLEHGNINQLEIINTKFHDLLYTMSKSPKLIKMINNLKAQIYRFRHIILSQEKMARRSNEDHILMVKAIKKHDADGVETLVREHILRGKAAVLKQLEPGNENNGKEF